MDDLEKIYDVNDCPTPEEIFIHLTYISKLLRKKEIKHWICYGTLLGAVREKSIIKHDYDFDLGILYEDYPRVLELNKEIEFDGYTFEKGFGVVYKIPNVKESEYKWRVSMKIKYKDQIVGDIYIYYLCNDGFLRRYDPVEQIYYWPNSTFPSAFVEELEQAEINDEFFPCPRFGEGLVEHFYGPHWKIPIKALSQDGQNHPDYDFYGNYKYLEIENLIKVVEDKFHIQVKPNFTKEKECNSKELKDLIHFKYMFPLDQIEWIKENEKINIKLHKKK